MEKFIEDSVIRYSFLDNSGEFGGMSMGDFSFDKYDRDLVIGDLNGDESEDVVASISNGGWAGGNAFGNDLFVFLNSDTGFVLSDVKPSNMVCGCDDGYFQPEKIEGGIIKGISKCYADMDSHLDPSLYYNATVILVDGKLQFEQMKTKSVK